MNKHILMNVVLIIIVILILPFFFERVVESWSVLEAVEKNPEAKYFLEAYPKSRLQGYIISKNAIEKEIDEIREDCGSEFVEKSYWKFLYTEQKENKTMTLWIDPMTRKTVCIIQELLTQDVKIPLGIKQNRKEITIKRGGDLSESIFFYNINGDETYYVKVDVIEKPPWLMKMEPPVQIYKPAGKDPIEMNVKVEPSKLELVVPKERPPNIGYIELEDIEGFVKINSVTLTFETPRPAPYKEYKPEKYKLILNVSSYYFKGMRSFSYKNEILNYTITLV